MGRTGGARKEYAYSPIPLLGGSPLGFLVRDRRRKSGALRLSVDERMELASESFL